MTELLCSSESTARNNQIHMDDLAHKEISLLDVLTTILSVYVLLQLVTEAVVPLSDDTKTIMSYADYFVCGVFLLDFGVRFRAAPSKLAFMKLGWIDLLSSIPVIPWMMLGRFTRIFRLIRVIRALRSTERLLFVLLRSRVRNTLLVVITIAVLLVVITGSAVLSLEKDVKDANITNVGDALWWATTTVTTVGYGDKYPVSAEGRIVAVILMVTGVGLFSTFSGTVAAFLLSPQENKETSQILAELKALREEVAAFTVAKHLSDSECERQHVRRS
jgi:voltage-gated potassium channel